MNYYANILGPLLLWFYVCVILKRLSLCAFASFLYGFKGWIRDLIFSAPDYFPSFPFDSCMHIYSSGVLTAK